MSDIEKLLARSKTVKIGETDVEVHSLSVNELVELAKMGDTNSEVRSQATRDIIRKSLKKSFPTATEEQIGNFDVRYISEFVNVLFDVSGLEADKKKLDEMTASFQA